MKQNLVFFFFPSPFFPPCHFNINAPKQSLRAKPIPSWNRFLFLSALNTEFAACFDTAGSVYICTSPNCKVRVTAPLWMRDYIPKAAIIVNAKQVKISLMWNASVFHLTAVKYAGLGWILGWFFFFISKWDHWAWSLFGSKLLNISVDRWLTAPYLDCLSI